MQFINAYWSKKAPYAMPARLKFETSNEGYPHFHLGLMFVERQKYAMFIKHVQRFLWSNYKDDKPTGYSREKQYSFRLFAVPNVSDVNGKRLTGKALIDKYLDEPTKEKRTDGGNWVVDFEGFNAAEYLANCQDPDHKEKATKWLKKFIKKDWGEDGPPPLDRRFLGNLPDLDHVKKLWWYICRGGLRNFGKS